jgi:GDP-L-fucose synthase
MDKDDRIFVAGHRGLVGSALVRALRERGCDRLILRTREELDLRDEGAVTAFYAEARPDYVFDAAARAGGILAHQRYPADFLLDNLRIQNNLIRGAVAAGVRKYLFIGSAAAYPRDAPQPLREDALLTGPPEPSHESYAIAKIAGIRLCQAFRRQAGWRSVVLMPTNLYGPRDDLGDEGGHVLPMLMRRFHQARVGGASEVTVWGTGSPRREFLHVDDFADAALFLMEAYDGTEIINVGAGEDVSIAELAGLLREVVGFEGDIEFDRGKPDGAPRRLLDVSRLHDLGWRHRRTLEEGVRDTYRWYAERPEARVE